MQGKMGEIMNETWKPSVAELERWFMSLDESQREKINVAVNNEYANNPLGDMRFVIQRRHIIEAMIEDGKPKAA